MDLVAVVAVAVAARWIAYPGEAQDGLHSLAEQDHQHELVEARGCAQLVQAVAGSPDQTGQTWIVYELAWVRPESCAADQCVNGPSLLLDPVLQTAAAAELSLVLYQQAAGFAERAWTGRSLTRQSWEQQ